LRDLIEDWKENGREILKRVAREQPGTYMKVMARIMPRETRVATTQSVIGALSDDQLATMIQDLQERIAAKLSGEDAKVISAEASPALTTLPQPTRYRRNPKSTPERLAKARGYMRKRRAAEKAEKQAETEKTDAAPSSSPSSPLVD
jgi:hypothetical protein